MCGRVLRNDGETTCDTECVSCGAGRCIEGDGAAVEQQHTRGHLPAAAVASTRPRPLRARESASRRQPGPAGERSDRHVPVITAPFRSRQPARERERGSRPERGEAFQKPRRHRPIRACGSLHAAITTREHGTLTSGLTSGRSSSARSGAMKVLQRCAWGVVVIRVQRRPCCCVPGDERTRRWRRRQAGVASQNMALPPADAGPSTRARHATPCERGTHRARVLCSEGWGRPKRAGNRHWQTARVEMRSDTGVAKSGKRAAQWRPESA